MKLGELATHRNVTKMNALLSLLNIIRISLEKVAAFGDDHNDEEMLRKCGFGIAVSNASPEALNSAKFIADSNDEDGVAKFIQRNFLKNVYL